MLGKAKVPMRWLDTAHHEQIMAQNAIRKEKEKII